jgi:DNA-binding MarR family transcriptional regulator
LTNIVHQVVYVRTIVDDASSMSERPGFELPVLLALAFRTLIDALHAELAEVGHPDARPIHGFALQAVGAEGTSVSELGRRLGVSKQAAAKTAAGLERLGYVARGADPTDARAVRLRRTPRGEQFLFASAAIFDRLHGKWERRLGTGRVAALEDDLARIVVGTDVKLGDLPGWLG